MRAAKKWMLRLRAKLAAMPLGVRLSAAALAAVCLAAGIWLAVAASRPRLVPLLNEPLAGQDLAAAEAVLEGKKIPHAVENGRLLVSVESVSPARALLAAENLLPKNTASTFEQLARETDIWHSQEQNEKRWQAAKMTALSRMIGVFPSVRSATVLYEPGTPRRLGAGASAPTAAVKVVLAGSEELSAKMVGAIADLVCGSIAGMSRENVRIVDGMGRSYRAAEETAAAPRRGIEDLRSTEAYYLDKIQSALAYIPNAIVTVGVAQEATGFRCTGASISMPRSYLASIHRSQGGRGEADDRAVQALAAQQIPRIQQTVSRLIGAADGSAVRVDWHYDVPAEASSPGVASAVSQALPGVLVVLACGAAAAALTTLLLLALRRGRRAGDEADEEAAPPANRSEGEGLFGFLQQVNEEDLFSFVKAEHPQMAAMILAHMEPRKAAKLLAGLAPAEQVEVSRRLAALERIDPEVVREVERSLAGKLAGVSARPRTTLSGAGMLAQILNHCGYTTEKAVLEGLEGREPDLAQSIRRRMFLFEDLASIPAGRLRAALEGVANDELAIALRTADAELKKRVLASLSSASAKAVREEMERIGPVRLSDVEAAQRRVLEAVCGDPGGRYAPAKAPHPPPLATAGDA